MSKVIEKLKNVGPGALVAAGFVGPGTVTTCTVSGASVGYTMLWALVFATVATIIFQEMAARVGIASQKGLGENIRDRIPNPVLKGLAIAIVIIAIFIGNVAYETGNITGGILGIQAVAPGIPMGAIVVVVGLLAAVVMFHRPLQPHRKGAHGHRRIHGRGVLGHRACLQPRLGRHRLRHVHTSAAHK